MYWIIMQQIRTIAFCQRSAESRIPFRAVMTSFPVLHYHESSLCGENDGLVSHDEPRWIYIFKIIHRLMFSGEESHR